MKMSMFEAGMIVCFGASWPVAILKTLKTRSVHGKSRMFLTLVLCGYGLGISHKILYNLDYVLLLYIFNFTMVLIEICLYVKYQKIPAPITASGAASDEYTAADTLLAEPEAALEP
jgi:hypothetical protein